MNEQQNHQRDTETLILQAAEKEFLEKGYAGAKTTSIAEAAGVTHAMLHYYFRTKDKLFEKIASDKMEKLNEIMFGAFGNSALPLKERIIQGVKQHFDFIAANPSLPKFIFNELDSHPERLHNLKNSIVSMATQTFNNLQNAINKGADEGRCRQINASMLMLDIVSLNIFPFLAAPIISTSFGIIFESREKFLEMRKNENVKTILEKLNIV